MSGPGGLSIEASVERILGHAGRMMSYSKSGYRERRPTNVCVFNSRLVTVLAGQSECVWWGDIDVTLWEERLVALARLIEKPLYLFYERDAADELLADLDRALLTVSPIGQVEHGEQRLHGIVRADDGTLRIELPPDTRKRFRWRTLRHRPRLWRFWHVERKRQRERQGESRRSTLLYLGSRDSGASPLLVLGVARDEDFSGTLRTFEWTWYPATRDASSGGKAAPRHPAEDHDRPRRAPRCESSFGRGSCGSCSSDSDGGRSL